MPDRRGVLRSPGPDRLHYRMVRCGQSGLLRSDPILPREALAALRARSELTYEAVVPFTRATYGHYLRRALPLVAPAPACSRSGVATASFS
jgi:hypothetical protein